MKIQIRSKGEAEITGYVNVVGRESRLLRDAEGSFIEMVKPGTFQRALEKTEEVGLMFNHMRDIGSTRTNLQLHEDNIGLYARALITDEEVIQRALDGKLSGWSFGFFIEKDSWDVKKDGTKLRTLEDINLVEVSVLDVTPAYIATSVEMRDGSGKMREYRYLDEKVEVDHTEPEQRQEEKHPPEVDSLAELQTLKRKFELEFILK